MSKKKPIAKSESRSDNQAETDSRIEEHMRSVDAYLSRGNIRLQYGLVATESDVAILRKEFLKTKF